MLRSLLLSAVLAIAGSGVAHAARPMIEPQNRLHAGVSVTGGARFDVPSVGGALGFDSRMTRLVSVDVGGFFSPGPMGEVPGSFDDASSSIYLRHGLYVAPGFRLPHRSNDGLNWDVLLRVGFAGAWWTDAQSHQTHLGDDYLTGLDPAGLAGLDLVLRKGSLGGRVSLKEYGFRPFSEVTLAAVNVLRPQGTAELFWQW